MIRSFSHQVEGVSFTARFPVGEEMPHRATLCINSRTYRSSVQEYFDDPASVQAVAEMLMQLAAAMKGDSPDPAPSAVINARVNLRPAAVVKDASEPGHWLVQLLKELERQGR